MSRLILLLLISGSVLAQDRKFNYTVTQTTDVVITAERNYKETLGVSKTGRDMCVVSTELQVEGQWHTAHGEYSGFSKEDSCKTAAILARKNLTSLIKPSIISSKAEITYEENGYAKHIDGYRKGDLVDVANLHLNPSYQRSFTYQGTTCKWFYDVKREEKGIKQYNLIACKLSAGWVVEDTF
jgi:hypothetical protein